jgi:two-component system, oxyanion-binding sensor
VIASTSASLTPRTCRPVVVASSLGLGHVRVPILAPFNLGLNGNAVTVTSALHAALRAEADGDIANPSASAAALARVVATRKRKGQEPLTFGMTFPYSTHNYQLRFWMASGGVDPDEDIRLVVLPPPFMVESIANGHVDAFCVGAPWNSVAVDLGIAHILHFVSEILERAAEKVLAVRSDWAHRRPEVLARLVCAHGTAADYVENIENREEVWRILSAPNRIGVAPDVIRRTLDGRLKVSTTGDLRSSERYLLVSRKAAAIPDPAQGAWLHAQMLRWGRRRCRRSSWPPRVRCSGPTSTTMSSAHLRVACRANRPMASALSPARPSIPATSPLTSRHG